MNKNKLLLISVIFLLLGLFLTVGLYDKVNPMAGINLSADKEDIAKKVKDFFELNEFAVSEVDTKIDFYENTLLIDKLHKSIGVEQSNILSRKKYPTYYWKYRITNNKNNDEKIQLVFDYDTQGKLVSFENYNPHPESKRDFSIDELKAFSDSLIFRKTIFSNAEFIKIKINNSDFYNAENGRYWKDVELNDEVEINYSLNDEIIKEDINISVLFKKGFLISIKSNYPIGRMGSYESQSVFINVIIKAVIVIVTIIIALIALFRRVRSGEIGFKIAGFISSFVFLISIFALFGSDGNTSFLMKVLNVFLSSVLISGILFVVWSITEVLIRESWPGKLSSFDLLINNNFNHSLIGENLIIGVSSGLLFTGIQCAVTFGLLNVYSFSIPQTSSSLSYISSDFPLVNISASGILLAIGLIVPFVGLIPALISKKISSNLLIVILSAVTFGAFRFGIELDMVHNIVLFFTVSVLFVFLFLKTDLLTVIITLFVNILFYQNIVFFNFGSMTFLNTALAFSFGIVLLFGFALICFYSKDKIANPLLLAPHYVRSISERERLIEEINSARDVQNSFLPRIMPEFEGLDIAAACKPAIEVGGDYYDFQEISEDELSFVIGDVSGKGTKAAFIMTLLKGFIKALYKLADQPKELLINLNNLFIDNVPKGNFVTVLLGKINVKDKTLKFSSAGHNPLIYRKNNGEILELNPDGMAIGLTRNSLFESNLKEIEIKYEPGDLLVTYTDGFTEAMNRKKEEFGIEKFKHIIDIFSDVESAEMLDLLIKHTDRFRGYAKQHDDMTIIIINFNH